ncbi:Trypanosome variant surface glycoprotein (A-type), putative [Trypanosoma equiperdum]|uniref:Trypanosome variant surface glycoprotein (A-type), putative n=1 Tax=Trypanosoma equiperdum TaxID=5694 RepID=A0A1G4IAC3_TRYEQ|nr:Trypanosome variant surface glycoprotein (A-type), putative [Trypanosoma equiperdum]
MQWINAKLKIIFVFAPTICGRKAAANNGEALGAETKAAICTINEEFGKTAETATAALKKRTDADHNLRITELKLQIYINQVTESRKLYLPLAAALTESKSSKGEQISNVVVEAGKVAAATTHPSGRIGEFMTIAAQSRKASETNVGCVAASSTATMDTAAALGPCGLAPPTIVGATITPNNLITREGYAGLTNTNGGTKTAGSTTKGILFNTAHSGDIVNSRTTKRNLAYARGYFTATTSTNQPNLPNMSSWQSPATAANPPA